MSISTILEAALFAATEPLTLRQLRDVLPDEAVDQAVVAAALAELAERYQASAVELVEVASGWRFQVRAQYLPYLTPLVVERPPRYSRALLETLAIIAYRQPVTRGDIEAIRGVAVSLGILRTLLEREWIRVVGHRETPGKPALYATTKQFLDYFNLTALHQLPSLPEQPAQPPEEFPT